jgi:ABC-type antimicrobial peptide transport system permease subunit
MTTLYAVKILKKQKLRLFFTIGGIALCILLMLFLLSVYYGVAEGTMEYIKNNKADLWVLQKNAENILRHASVLLMDQGVTIRGMKGVRAVSPVLMLISGIRKNGHLLTVFLSGYDPSQPLGGPPHIVKGRNVEHDDEIVLDKSFARKNHFDVGDSAKILDNSLRVVGISTGTNSFAVQYAFVTLHRAQMIFGIPSFVTSYLVTVKEGNDIQQVRDEIRSTFTELEVYDHETFVKNNTREMEAGLLPIYYTVSLIGIIVLTTILSMILSINILEHRRDFAILKALGAPSGFLPSLIIQQSMVICALSSLVALVMFFPMTALIEYMSPEITTQTSVNQMAAVLALVTLISLLSSLISIHKLRTIYPIEAFS